MAATSYKVSARKVWHKMTDARFVDWNLLFYISAMAYFETIKTVLIQVEKIFYVFNFIQIISILLLWENIKNI